MQERNATINPGFNMFRNRSVVSECAHRRASERVSPILLTVFAAFWLAVYTPLHALAQANPNPSVDAANMAPGSEEHDAQDRSEEQTLHPDDIEALIANLEDPVARDALVSRLRTLLQVAAGGDSNKQALELSDALQLDEKVGDALTQYLGTLARLDLSSGRLGQIAVVAVLAGIAMGLALLNAWLAKALDRRVAPLRRRAQIGPNRFSSIFTWQRYAGLALIGGVWLYAMVTVIWDQPPDSAVGTAMSTALQTIVAVAMVILLFLVIWETINSVLESAAERKDVMSSRRAKTLLPVVRNVITFTLILLSSLVILSELGIDVVPLLAGAGVVGVAIGFGAQTLVKDFLTGFTIIVEDLLQLGDVVAVAGRQGVVKHISMRRLELRSLDGTVHNIPFGVIDVVDNLTKDYSYYMLDVGVGYREDPDEVVAHLRAIDEEMRNDKEYKDDILEPLDVLGLDEFGDSAVVIKARIKTSPREKWRIGREFNRRMKKVFDEKDVEIPFPHQTIYFGVDKEGEAPPFPPFRPAQSRENSADQTT